MTAVPEKTHVMADGHRATAVLRIAFQGQTLGGMQDARTLLKAAKAVRPGDGNESA